MGAAMEAAYQLFTLLQGLHVPLIESILICSLLLPAKWKVCVPLLLLTEGVRMLLTLLIMIYKIAFDVIYDTAVKEIISEK